jgi:hypothetical protein
MSAGKCEAKSQTGKRCTLNASKEVGGAHFCGNHANKALATQLRSSERGEETRRIEKGGSHLVFKEPVNTPAEDFLRTLKVLMGASVPEFVLVQMLQAWKAGQL